MFSRSVRLIGTSLRAMFSIFAVNIYSYIPWIVYFALAVFLIHRLSLNDSVYLAGPLDVIQILKNIVIYLFVHTIFYIAYAVLICIAVLHLRDERPAMQEGLARTMQRIGPLSVLALLSGIFSLLFSIVLPEISAAIRYHQFISPITELRSLSSASGTELLDFVNFFFGPYPFTWLGGAYALATISYYVSILIDLAWLVLILLPVPVLVLEKVGIGEAIRRSAGLLKKTWGEQIIGNLAISILGPLFDITVLLVLIRLIDYGLHVQPGATEGFEDIPALLLVYLMIPIQNTLAAIYIAAVYRFGRDDVLAFRGQKPQSAGAS